MKFLCICVAMLCGCALWEGGRPAGVRYADEFDLSKSVCGKGKTVRACASVDGHPLTLGGQVRARGFGAHPESAVAFRANGKVTAFDALVGVDADSKAANPYGRHSAVVFRIWSDRRIVWESKKILDDDAPVPVHVDLAGAREIVLETVGAATWYDFTSMNGDWAEARFTCARGAELELVDDPALFAQLGVLTPAERPEPRINGADIWGVRPGHPVIFRVATSGERPMRFTATGLPEGVTLDGRGVLRGTAPGTPGDYDISVTAENAKGKAVRVIRLAVGETIALTPPMGWNSWNTCCHRLTQEKAMAAARAMEEAGLGDHGWSYVNLDDWWQMNNNPESQRHPLRLKELGDDFRGTPRTADGRIVPNRSFPDMRGLVDYIHSFGFKAGLYSSPGPETCGGCEGSYGHEREDAETYADWGFDYLKYDWCSYSRVFKRETGYGSWGQEVARTNLTLRAAYEKPYRLMGEYLRKQKRDILFSFCQYGMAQAELWARDAGANCWRTCDDLKDQWAWLESSLDSCRGGEFWRFAGPGCWADPDMMIVGRQYSFAHDHPSYLTPNEQYTHVSLWAMVCSPLLLGCDLTQLDAFTRSLLVNDEVIALSQDRLGRPARRVRHTDLESVWARPLANGDRAVALVNRYPLAREISFEFAEVGAERRCRVRDCWRQACEGAFEGRYSAVVPPHATKLVRLRDATCLNCEEK